MNIYKLAVGNVKHYRSQDALLPFKKSLTAVGGSALFLGLEKNKLKIVIHIVF